MEQWWNGSSHRKSKHWPIPSKIVLNSSFPKTCPMLFYLQQIMHTLTMVSTNASEVSCGSLISLLLRVAGARKGGCYMSVLHSLCIKKYYITLGAIKFKTCKILNEGKMVKN
jgi:hypothetical protein